MDALDGWRALAISSVLLFHAASLMPLVDIAFLPRWCWCGVDLFFVLSGFLITGVLVSNRESPRYFIAFYSRRALRIFPVYYAALVIGLVVLPWLGLVSIHIRHLGYRPVSMREQIWFWSNLSNLRTAFAPMVAPNLTHFWTLAIEEQFYLVWPLLLRVVRPKRAAIVCVLGLVLSPVLRALPAVQAANSRYPDLIYRFTCFHLDGMFAGALLALLLPLCNARRAAKVLQTIFFASIAALLYFNRHHSSVWEFSALALLFTAVIGYTVLRPNGLTSRTLSLPLLVRIGRRSYAFYVVHLPLTVLIVATLLHFTYHGGLAHPDVVFASVVAVSFLMSWSVAELSWLLIERPVLSLKNRFSY